MTKASYEKWIQTMRDNLQERINLRKHVDELRKQEAQSIQLVQDLIKEFESSAEKKLKKLTPAIKEAFERCNKKYKFHSINSLFFDAETNDPCLTCVVSLNGWEDESCSLKFQGITLQEMLEGKPFDIELIETLTFCAVPKPIGEEVLKAV